MTPKIYFIQEPAHFKGSKNHLASAVLSNLRRAFRVKASRCGNAPGIKNNPRKYRNTWRETKEAERKRKHALKIRCVLCDRTKVEEEKRKKKMNSNSWGFPLKKFWGPKGSPDVPAGHDPNSTFKTNSGRVGKAAAADPTQSLPRRERKKVEKGDWTFSSLLFVVRKKSILSLQSPRIKEKRNKA